MRELNHSWKRTLTHGHERADSYPVAFWRRKRGDAEDFGKEMRGAQRVMRRTRSSPQSFTRRLKATGYECDERMSDLGCCDRVYSVSYIILKH